LTSKEGVEAIEVDLASVAEVNGVLVTALARLGGAALFIIEVDSDTGLITIEALARP
jgi:hypothetical protein